MSRKKRDTHKYKVNLQRMKWYFARSPGGKHQTMCGRDLQTVTRGWSKKTKHQAFFFSLSGGYVATSGLREGEERWPWWGVAFSFLTRVRGWRGTTLTRRCGFSWSPLPGSWRCRWPGGKTSPTWGKQSLVSPYCNITIIILPLCRYDIYCMSTPLPPKSLICLCRA